MTSVRGSEWRRWDLHLHTPETKLNDQFKATAKNAGAVWEQYCELLERSDVAVFGITDYFSSDGYFKAREELGKRFPNSQKVLIPNIELRTNEVINNDGGHVNIHVLFNPFKPGFEDSIKNFLSNLKTTKTVGGRTIKVSELKASSDFESATVTRDDIADAIERVFGKPLDITEFVLVVTAANNDGIRPAKGAKRAAQLSDEIDKMSDGFFGNFGNRKYFLRVDRYEDKKERAARRPVFSGSDAHSFVDLNAALNGSGRDTEGTWMPTWIKADPTYEGLRQTLFEPEERVFIGEEPEVLRRVKMHPTKYIDSLYINAIPRYDGRFGTWFVDERVPINKELVAIIGNKGSGKSALADILGLTGNSRNQVSHATGKREELFSFLNADKFLKANCAANFRAELGWCDGRWDSAILNDTTSQSLPEKVEYLPQKYLERICATVAHDEFRSKLEEVIFGYVQPHEKYGKRSLDELIAFLTEQADNGIRIAKAQLQEKNRLVASIQRKLTSEYRQEINGRITLKAQELAAHRAAPVNPVAKPQVMSEASTKDREALERTVDQIAKLEQQMVDLQTERAGLAKDSADMVRLMEAIEVQKKPLLDIKVHFNDVFKKIGVSFEDVITLNINPDPISKLLERHKVRLREIDALLISEEVIQLIYDAKQAKDIRAASVVCQRDSLLAEKEKLVERLGKPEKDYQEFVVRQTAWLAREKELLGSVEDQALSSVRSLERELERITKDYVAQLRTATEERDAISKEILSRKVGLIAFYNSIKESIDLEIQKHSQSLGDYDLAIRAGLQLDPRFPDKFLEFINQAVKGSFHGSLEGRAALEALYRGVSDWGDAAQVFPVISSIENALHLDGRRDISASDRERNLAKQLKNQVEPSELYDYLYGFDYLNAKYDLRVDGKDLSELSPGERGGLLLVFYLMLDQRDVPLVIDQPEDNLDNRSVYEMLVRFLKIAKRRRQIIMVTHNPNLAVVADAEQVIHVTIDKKNRNDFDFYAGSIENPRINSELLNVLEGTLPAFDNRRLKYRQRH